MTVSVPRGDSSRYIANLLPESSPLGAVLAGLFGFRSAPTPLEVLAYFAYLIPVVAIYLYTDRPRQLQRPPRRQTPAPRPQTARIAKSSPHAFAKVHIGRADSGAIGPPLCRGYRIRRDRGRMWSRARPS
jgi:hypothetical protein